MQLQLVAAGARQHGQQPGIHHRTGRSQRQDRRAQRVQPPAQAGWHDLFQFDQCGDRSLLDAADGAGHGGAQGHGRGQGFVVVQQQWGQGAPRTERIPAGHAAAGLDRVAELAQAVDVAAQGARMHAGALCQGGAGPVWPRLQQGQ
ncbi:hypothetical protein V8017_14310 [Stenotrophomonas rhizophila]